MRTFTYAGPGLVVLLAAAAALLAAPMSVRSAADAKADADIVLAARVLEEESVLEAINRANRAIARLVEPSVVHVSTMGSMQRRQFLAPYSSSGSGWIWSEDGHIVTNAHVVENAERLQVQLFDGELREAELVGLDLRTDVAVIKVAAGGLHASLRGDSATVEQGDTVYAFGSPFDFRFSMSSGIVSGLGRSAGLEDIDYENFIQTDAAINPGNSGGPLTDIRGRVIGMNTAIATGRGNNVGQGQFAGIGLAIPMSMIESVVTQIIETGEVRKGFLGVSVVPLERARVAGMRDEALDAALGEYKGDGALVASIGADSPAERAGFQRGDVIVSIDGQRVASDEAVPAIISSKRPGTEVRFSIWRLDEDGGRRMDIVATLEELDMGRSRVPYLASSLRRLGVERFSTATEARAREFGVPFRRGVIIEEILEGSEIDGAVPAGSVIVGVGDVGVGSLDELQTRVVRFFGERPRGRGEMALSVVVPDGRVVVLRVPIRM
ncbi:MAG: S1C family serine protease [Phycisphaerales bacterium]